MTTRTPISFIATDAPEAAEGFYRDVLGLRLVEASPFALVFDEHGMMLRVQIVEALEPVAYTVHGWQVADIAAEMARLGARGVVFEHFGLPGQEESGVWPSPAGAKIAWFKDPSGNVLSLTEFARELSLVGWSGTVSGGP